ncbi:hypothetical protein AB1E18_019634 [Capra hircus]
MHQGNGDLGAQEGKALALQHAQEAGPARRVPVDRAPTGKQGSLRAQRDGGHAPPAAVSRAGQRSGLGGCSRPSRSTGPGATGFAARCSPSVSRSLTRSWKRPQAARARARATRASGESGACPISSARGASLTFMLAQGPPARAARDAFLPTLQGASPAFLCTGWTPPPAARAPTSCSLGVARDPCARGKGSPYPHPGTRGAKLPFLHMRRKHPHSGARRGAPNSSQRGPRSSCQHMPASPTPARVTRAPPSLFCPRCRARALFSCARGASRRRRHEPLFLDARYQPSLARLWRDASPHFLSAPGLLAGR